MLISHSHRFIFIHIYKTGGSSIRRLLNGYCDHSSEYRNPVKKMQLKFGLRPNITGKNFNSHISSSELKTMIPSEIFDKYFKFAVVRNPWDWQVSLYEYARQSKRHPEFELTNSFKDFEDYLKWRINGNFALQADFILDNANKLLVDKVIKLEKINEEIPQLCHILGVSQREIPHLNKSRRRPYYEYYNDRTREMIANTFARDISLLDYKF